MKFCRFESHFAICEREMFEKSATHEVFRELIACQNDENEELENMGNELKIDM